MTTPASPAAAASRARNVARSVLLRMTSSPPAPPEIGRRSAGISGGRAPGGTHIADILRAMADLKSRVAARLAEMAPYLERSGASVEFVGVEDGVAQLKVWLTRPGASRLVASLQLKNGIERALRDAIPELRAVEAINLPPHTLVGWDQAGFTPVELPKT